MMTTLVQTTLLRRIRSWFSLHHWAQIALVVQPLIVVRTGAEYLRLRMSDSGALPSLVEPLFVALAGVGILAIVTLVLYFFKRERAVVVLTLFGVVALIAYKLMAMPGLG